MKKTAKVKTKSRTKEEPLLSRVARQVGRTAGMIVAAGQGLGMTEVSAEEPGGGGGKSRRKPRPRLTTKKKKTSKKSPRSRKK